ncbi:glycosyltransferase family 4 protein [Umezakia ovalisporum]|uniref:Glycosyltransferase family 4 protein n=1 Tax=Umezakia ovalisporum FSS-62 TaxID=2971776 RepID=A0AA43KDZ5_9CYAN|nr:glycosyltransferase family 4 protein [Umezakia ovalisporum]MBI1242334.1 glycosyltransferase [Nostoc sp. RI_552]MDH6062952.1 glycosyltransferase family 4 protein [Umezakia ovalisporum FSS-62]MDH6086370.1 glycosyltransferase family 4 protein [Umezakia ovalisporum TAC611]MDH6089054.1 glycosyltransferase family 4 protein [Umezakia ovalisporum Ak1311]MDH6104095.1 glycosyltransferase family 4 protein [Umezakia ovalisporum ANA283AFssAo]
MHILMLSSTFPYPPTRGGTQVRTFNLLKYLSQRHTITLVTQRDDDVTEIEIVSLRDWVDHLVVFERPPDSGTPSGILQKIQRLSQFLQQGTPPSVLSRYSVEMQAWIDNFVEEQKCDVITCEHSVNEIYVRWHFQKSLRTIVNIHSSVYGTCLNQLTTGVSENKLRDRIILPLLRRYEQRYGAKFSAIVVTTENDKSQLEKLHPHGEITVIPNGVDLDTFPHRTTDPGGYKLVFIGAMDNLANIDAVCFFANEILPQIQKHYPQTTFDIVGSRPGPEVLALKQQPGINVTGRVPSMVDYLHKSTVCVVPMRTGFGIKNKTLEAMAAGVPVVASDRGLEGLATDTSTPALRANEPAEYVTAISQLFDDPQLRHQISHNGRKLVETQFTWAMAGKHYEQVCVGLNNH